MHRVSHLDNMKFWEPFPNLGYNQSGSFFHGSSRDINFGVSLGSCQFSCTFDISLDVHQIRIGTLLTSLVILDFSSKSALTKVHEIVGLQGQAKYL